MTRWSDGTFARFESFLACMQFDILLNVLLMGCTDEQALFQEWQTWETPRRSDQSKNLFQEHALFGCSLNPTVRGFSSTETDHVPHSNNSRGYLLTHSHDTEYGKQKLYQLNGAYLDYGSFRKKRHSQPQTAVVPRSQHQEF